MKWLTTLSPSDFAALKAQVTGTCSMFEPHPLPPGTTPPEGRVGIEITTAGATAVYLEPGHTYHGPEASVRRWVTAGVLMFTTFENFTTWARHELAAAYQAEVAAMPSVPDAHQLTDLAAVAAPTPEAPIPPPTTAALEQALAARVCGQDAVLHALSGIVARHLARVTPRRPATVLAMGPTGVGKTATAEALADALATHYGERATYLRVDCNEYAEAHRVSQLLGAPPGYVGHGEGALLADTLATAPQALVLFDEIEKAHPQLLRVLMNAMDAGRLTRPSGTPRTIDCTGAMFFFTSNLAAEELSTQLSRADSAPSTIGHDTACRTLLRDAGLQPELVGRIGRILPFRPLTATALAQVVTLAIHREARTYDIDLTYIAPDLVSRVLRETRTNAYGARPCEYAIDELLGDTLAAAAARGASGAQRLTAGPPVQVVPVRAGQGS